MHLICLSVLKTLLVISVMLFRQTSGATSSCSFLSGSRKLNLFHSGGSKLFSYSRSIAAEHHVGIQQILKPTLRLNLTRGVSLNGIDNDSDVTQKTMMASTVISLNLPEEETVHMRHLMEEGTTISSFWILQLHQLTHSAAINLIPQLVSSNPVGFVGASGAPAKSGSLVGFYTDQKIKHPDKIILMRNGEFYETFGIDAIMLIAYSGLNSMGGKPKAGCPIGNVQATLDGLTSKGFSVAVYEEAPESVDDKIKTKTKKRYLSQIVFPGAKIYTYNLSLRQGNIDFPENNPVVGIMKTVGGYTMCQIYLDEEAIEISQRLTIDTVRVLAMGRHVQPIYLGKDVKKDILGPGVETITVSNVNERDFPDQVLRRFSLTMPTIKSEKFKARMKPYERCPRPPYISTALQIGLIPNPNVPSLIPNLLPKSHSMTSAQFLSKWIRHPPSHDLADHMKALCSFPLHLSIPEIKTLQVNKVVSLLSAGEGNLALFADITSTVEGVLDMLLMMLDSAEHGKADVSREGLSALLPHLLAITTAETGISTQPYELQATCQKVLEKIRGIVASEDESLADRYTYDATSRIPRDFFSRSEEPFRGRLSRGYKKVDIMYVELEEAAAALILAVKEDFPLSGEVRYDILNNLICFVEVKEKKGRKKVSGGSAASTGERDADSDSDDDERQQSDRQQLDLTPLSPTVTGSTDVPKSRKRGLETKYIHPLDRKFKPLNSKYTTQRVVEALSSYLAVTEKALVVTGEVLRELSGSLYSAVTGIQQAAAYSIILKAAVEHTISARQKNWCVPTLVPFPSDGSGVGVTMKVTGISPFWIDRRDASLNDVELAGIFLLTAPNMSGKSTMMRSILVAALLANCGLYVPCSTAQIPRYDNFFLRTSSHDVPSEGKSAFGIEMEDMNIVLDGATHQSLIMIDELGKGTSSRDGSGLAGALLEYLDEKKVSGIFATHLHELLLLNLNLPHTQNRRMGFLIDEKSGRLKWTYKLLEGVCTNSHALETAHQFGIPIDIINRAGQLARDFDRICRPAEASAVASADTDSDSDKSVASGLPISAGQPQSYPPAVTPHPSNSGTASYTPSPTNTVAPFLPLSKSLGSKVRYSIDDVGPLFEELIRNNSMNPIIDSVPHNHSPPLKFEGVSCVYVIIINRESQQDEIYVGETDDLTMRLKAHRSQLKDAHLTVCVAAVSNKTFARRMESEMQLLLLRRAFVLRSDTDSKHKNSAAW